MKFIFHLKKGIITYLFGSIQNSYFAMLITLKQKLHWTYTFESKRDSRWEPFSENGYLITKIKLNTSEGAMILFSHHQVKGNNTQTHTQHSDIILIFLFKSISSFSLKHQSHFSKLISYCHLFHLLVKLNLRVVFTLFCCYSLMPPYSVGLSNFYSEF